MILSNTEIISCLERGSFRIDPHPGKDAALKPFNTSAVDLRLGDEILVPNENQPFQLDLRQGAIASFLAQHSGIHSLSSERPYSLRRGKLVLGKTLERVHFPIIENGPCYGARIEGRSSIARCGILVHFTAPTIHAGFHGTITLEIINFGAADFLLFPGMAICQLIIEEIRGCPVSAPNQFSGQQSAAGVL